MNSRPRTLLLAVTMLVIVSACGGSSGDGDSTTTPPPTINYTKVGGRWNGQTTTDGIQGYEQVMGVVSERGDGLFFSTSAIYVIDNVRGTDGNATLDFTAYALRGFVFSDGSVVTAGTLEAVVSERDSVTGSWVTTSGDSGALSVEYHSSYDIESSMAILAGIYSNDFGTLVIDPDGSLFMQDIDGCVFSGMSGEIDKNFNLYDMSFDITDCGNSNSHVTGYVQHFTNGNSERIEIMGASDIGFVFSTSLFQYN